MCLYPRLIENRKYRANKKNGGVIPPLPDQRVKYVPIGCETCIECRKQKSRSWQCRLQEDIKEYKNGKFITLTFSTESLRALYNSDEKASKLKGYDLDNYLATKAVRYFLERWRKKHKKSLRHWLVTELGDGTTEHIHLHGIVWTNNLKDVEEKWQYGYVWKGYMKNGSIQNYVNAKTVNYIVKYISKMDDKHLNYKPIVLTSPGIGKHYTINGNYRTNKYNGNNTRETYKNEQGNKIALPIYWRNKIYTEKERENLWLQKLDKGERWICGERIKKGEIDLYYNLLEYHRNRTHKLGYPKPEFIWSKKKYEEDRRKLLHEKRIHGKKTLKESDPLSLAESQWNELFDLN